MPSTPPSFLRRLTLSPSSGHRPPWLRGVLWVAIGLLVSLGAWILVVAAQKALFFQRTGLDQDNSNVLRMATKEVLTHLIEPYYNHRLISTTELPIYDLQLSPKRLAEWHTILDRVTERGKAQPEDQIYLPGRFRHGDEVYEVDIRGRGTLAGHYRKAKPSIRVKFPKDRHFEGDRVVNFIIPYEQTRVVVDTTLNEIARRHGLLAYRRQFAVLRLNGKVLGVYQRMEHFRKELAVKQGRSEGFFVSALGQGKGGSDTATHLGFQAAVKAMTACTRGCSPRQAENLLDHWLDEERLATYCALTTWFYSDHAWGPDNLILFFDPGYGRLEPIPWDVGTLPIYFLPHADEHPEWVVESTVDMGEALLAVPRFRQRRNEILWQLVRQEEAFAQAEAKRQFEAIRPSLDYDTEYSRRRTRRFYDSFSRIVRGNAALVERVLAQRRLVVTGSEQGLRVINWSVGEARMERLEVVSADGRRQVVELAGDLVPGRFNAQLGVLDIAVELDFPPHTVHAVASHHLSGETFAPDEVTWQRAAPTVDEAMPPRPVHRAPPFTGPVPSLVAAATPPPGIDWPQTPPAGVRVDASTGAWHFSGQMRLDHSLAVPQGVPVVFEPGLLLRLGADVSLIIRGDLSSLGSSERPIVIAAAEPRQPFDTLAVLGRAQRPTQVRVRHTTVDGGQEGDFLGVHFSGAFSIYGGDLEMHHSRILNAAGEDGLNVKYGATQLHHTVFENTWGDALDLDFSNAELSHNRVRHSGGDGFDFSGSTVQVYDCTFEDIADKGLSVGENSQVKAWRNSFRRATTGIAVKDLSEAELQDNSYMDLEVAIAIYQKKQVFASGRVTYRPARLENVASELLLDPGARATRH